MSASCTWLRSAEDLVTGERLLRRPEHAASVAARYRFPRRVQLETRALRGALGRTVWGGTVLRS